MKLLLPIILVLPCSNDKREPDEFDDIHDYINIWYRLSNM